MIPIPVPKGTLHLKCLVSAVNDRILVVADNENGRQLWGDIQRSTEHYSVVMVPDEISANVLAMPDKQTLLIQKGFPHSEAVLREKLADWKIVSLNMSENIKADGALTCLSVFAPSPFDTK